MFKIIYIQKIHRFFIRRAHYFNEIIAIGYNVDIKRMFTTIRPKNCMQYNFYFSLFEYEGFIIYKTVGLQLFCHLNAPPPLQLPLETKLSTALRSCKKIVFGSCTIHEMATIFCLVVVRSPHDRKGF